jgi:hypothetical protein
MEELTKMFLELYVAGAARPPAVGLACHEVAADATEQRP